MAGGPVDVYVSERHVAVGAATFFRRAIASTGVVPVEVTTAGTGGYVAAPAAVLPGVLHEMGKAI